MRLSLRAAHHTPPLPPVSLSRVLEQFSDTFHKQQPDVLLNSTFCKTELPQYQCGHITPLFQRLCNIICPCHSESYAPGFKVKLTEQSSLDANETIMNLHPVVTLKRHLAEHLFHFRTSVNNWIFSYIPASICFLGSIVFFM